MVGRECAGGSCSKAVDCSGSWSIVVGSEVARWEGQFVALVSVGHSCQVAIAVPAQRHEEWSSTLY